MLIRKLIRTMGRYRAQFISMVVMIALGVGVFVGFNMEWYTIETDVFAHLEATGFSDYRVFSEKGFTPEQRDAVLALEGVKEVTRFLSINTATPDGDTLALTVAENPAVSGFILTAGGEYDPESEDGLWLSDRYAESNGVSVGDVLALSYKDYSIEGVVKGLIKSGEYMICVPDETQLMPDFNTYGYVYAAPPMLQRLIDDTLAENAALSVLARLAGENISIDRFYVQLNCLSLLEKKDFAERVENALGETVQIVSKEDTISYAEAMGESEEGKTMGSILPVLFLAIAVLTMVTTMHRLTASEKTQIGTLKALGFKNRRILVHYSCYALAVGLLGTGLGILLGWGLGWFIMNPGGAMATYIDLPDWSLHTPPFVWYVLALINVFLMGIGFLSVRSMLRGTAADTLRPYVPKKARRLLMERFPWWDNLSFGVKWNLRDSLRHKSRTFMTLFGIVGCMVLLVGGLGMQETLDAFVDMFYNQSIRYETRINLDVEAVSNEEAAALAGEYQGDFSAQSAVQIDGDTVALEIYRVDNGLVRFLASEGGFSELPEDGALICERLSKDYGLKTGDSFAFSPFGKDVSYTVRVAGVVRSLTRSILLSDAYADAIGLEYKVNTLYTIQTDIPADSRILNTQAKSAIIASFDTFTALMHTMVALLVAAAVILGIVVLYNLGVMSYTERYREMATLKVIGFKDGQISRILIGQNLWLTVIGVALGVPAGVAVLQYLLDALASEYEMVLALGPLTYCVSILLTFGVALLVGVMVARKNRFIDMVEALKVQE